MWQYFIPHAIFHLMRWFPRDNRLKVRIILLLFICSLLVPQFYILLQPATERWCHEPLFECLIVSIVFTFCVMGFSFLFSIMDPVPRVVKIAFHVFGLGTFIMAILILVFTSRAQICQNFTPELYYFSIAVTIMAVVSMVFFLVVVPFWIINFVKKNLVLDYRNRDGICYEPVKCCSCVWHV